MFKHILVPLDGSPLAEQALLVAARIARQTGSTISLLESVPPLVETVPYFHQDIGVYSDTIYEEMLTEAKEYLQRISHDDRLAGVTVSAHTSAKSPIEAILDYAQEKQVDLIVLYSHGYTGVKRWALGSVAQKLASHSPIPTLILRDDNAEALAQPEKPHPVRALVALDGSQFAEATLLPAAQLVAALNGPSPAAPAELNLVRVIQPPRPEEEVKYQRYDSDLRGYQKDAAEFYLNGTKEKFAQTLAALNLQVISSVIEDTDIAGALLKVAETGNTVEDETNVAYDLVAIATHGKGALQRLVMGSIAERVTNESKLPILLVRPPDEA
jgi:nucleotide-binding universal stress UspA family protein